MCSSSGRSSVHAGFCGMFFMHLCKQSSKWKNVHILPPATLLHHVPPMRSLMDRYARFHSLLVQISQILWWRSSPNSYLSLKVPSKGTPSPGSPSRATYGERERPLSRAFVTYLFTQRREKPHFTPIDPSLSLLFCPSTVCKPLKPLDIHRNLWAMNPVFPG